MDSEQGNIHECLSLQQWLCPRLVWAAGSIVGDVIFLCDGNQYCWAIVCLPSLLD